MDFNSIPVLSPSAYASPPVPMAGWQTSDYQQQYQYWNYDKQKQMDVIKTEYDRMKYELSGYEQKFVDNEGKINELIKYRDGYKNDLYRLNNEMKAASDRKTDCEAKRYTVKEKMSWATGSDVHWLAREKEQLDTEIYRLADVISSTQWKINDQTGYLNTALSSIEQLKNENYSLKETSSNMRYKLQELYNEYSRLEREKAAG